ncbi:MAG: hypothetical protein ACI9OJ_005025, partial [Myxococcota bacterium]
PVAVSDGDRNTLKVRNSSVTTPPSPRNFLLHAHRAQKSRIVHPYTQEK